MLNKLFALNHLDQQLAAWKVASTAPMPKQGWVRTIRKALGMTIKQLAKRLGVDPSRVVKLEMSEPNGATTLNSLRATAAAMDCQFVYAFVPRTTLEDLVSDRAEQIAREMVERTSHSMKLEAQGVEDSANAAQVYTLTQELLNGSWKHLWEDQK